MGWHTKGQDKICLDCTNEYEYVMDTLSFAAGNRGQCTKCGSGNTKFKEAPEERQN